ncbi:MAG: alanine racemase [Clostridiales bacterium]|nr:alanine racemase [Clostridiales bacterium]
MGRTENLKASTYTKAYIDLLRLRNNYSIIKSITRSRIMCVVKADAYGHGAVKCAQALYKAGARDFAVAHIDEAVEIRNALGPDCIVMIIGSADPSYAGLLLENDITISLYSLEYAKRFDGTLLNGRIKAHIKVDTGMNRIGFRPDKDGAADAVAASRLPFFEITGVFSHLARADETGNPMTDLQINKFKSFTASLESRGVSTGIKHISASSAILESRDARFDMVRPGVMLYGMQPSDNMQPISALGFKPVLSLKSRIINIHRISAGESVSYGSTWTAKRDTLVATLPLGYGDGFIRAYSGMTVEIKGEKRPIIGRICMDQCMVDVTGLDVNLFDEVGIITDTNPIEDFARKAGTITYECSCLLNSRIPRIYI